MAEAGSTQTICIEVAYALPERQHLEQVSVPAGTTARQALTLSSLATEFPELPLASCPLGIFGRAVQDDAVVTAGDRVEVYRPLSMDPRAARRLRAQQGRTMGRED